VRAVAGGFGASRLYLVRLTASGAYDPAFGVNGWREIAHAELGDTKFLTTGFAVDAHGRAHVLVTHSDPAELLDLDVTLLRYEADGDLDTSFGTGGLWPVSDGGPADSVDATAHRVALAADGSIFATFLEPGTDYPCQLFGLRASDGLLVYRGSTATEAAEIVVQGNGRLIWARDADPADGFVATRYRVDDDVWLLGDGSPWVTVDFDVDQGGDDEEELVAVALWHGRPVFGGTASGPVGSTESFVLRAENAFIFADGFASANAALWSDVEP